jgi:adenine-specific DNA-methyltransferase
MDFFTGSGTTIATAHKLGKKWLGVELNNYFDTDVMVRMKWVLGGKKVGISKKNNCIGGGFFKYYSLEQYEDTLRNMKYKDSSPNSIFDTRKAFEQYVFYADQKFAHVLEVKEDILEIDFDKLYPNIDFAETLSNLLGLPIKKITKNSVVLQDGDSEKEIKTDYKNMNESEKLAFVRLLKPAIWWGE